MSNFLLFGNTTLSDAIKKHNCSTLLLLFYSFEDEELGCSQGKGVYLSAVATVMFFIASCLNCCSPQADPFCYNFGQKHKPATRTVEEPGRTTVVLQPIVIQNDTTNNNSDTKVKKPIVKKKKAGTMSNKV